MPVPLFATGRRTFAAGAEVDFVASEWADCVVLVEHGVLEVECCTGTRARFPAGAVLTFAGLRLRRLHSAGDTDLVLRSLTRNCTRQR